MLKKNVIFEAPVLSRSGYGQWADALFLSLSKYSKWDVNIVQTAWGACPNRSATENKDKLIESKIIRSNQIEQPDVYICQTIPNMSKAPIGKIANINISAGIEVDNCYTNVIEGLNKHNLNIVCSEFAKHVFEHSTNKVTSPIEVVPWSADTNIFKMTKETNLKVEEAMSVVEEEECFLFVGQYTHGSLFGDRKDIGNLIKTFLETFKGQEKKPALILKTSGVSFSTMDRNDILMKVQAIKNMVGGDLPNVYVIHGELSDNEMNALFNHNKVIAHISFTHSEGFGMPLLQASLSGKPVIAPNYSGHLDFLPKERAILLDGKLEEIHPSLVSEYFPPKSKWFNVDYNKAMTVLMNFYKNDRTLHNTLATLLAKENANLFNLEKMDYRLHKVLDRYIK
jgi:glycosyltransferase involved in cell wall biosynthesis